MGLGDFLKKFALPIAGVAAAPFTGGTSLLATLGKGALAAAPAIGSALSGAAKGSADQRIAEQPGMVSTQLANLQGSQFQASERDAAMRRAMLASLLGGVQDASIGRPAGSTIPTFNVQGGLRPSALSNRDALIAQLGSAPIQGPAPLELPKAGGVEKGLGWAGIAGNILGALGGAFGQPQQAKLGGPYATPPLVQNQNISSRRLT